MLESKEDKIKKTTQTKDEVIETTNENEVISEQVNVDIDSKEVEVDDEVTKASSTEKVTADSKESDTQEIVIDEKTPVSSDVDVVSKDNSNEVEGDTEQEKPNKEDEIIKYDTLSLEELTAALENIILTQKVQHIKSSVEAIKSAFNLRFGTLLAEKKSLFLAEGGNTIDFQYSSPIKTKYNKLLSDYKKQKDIHYSNLEKQLKII